jgi:LysR family transcriptional regulator, regulator for metE and metH
MEIRHLRLIKAIVEEGSLTKAIDQLHLTQSALSHQLKEAEYQLGTPVFLRINRKLVLTPAGEKVYELAKDILGKLSDTELQIRQMVQGESGEIRISTECYTSYYWLPPLMQQFHQLYPNVELRIVMEATHHPLQKLLSGDLDVAITSDPIKDAHLNYTELFEDEMVAVVPESHAWTRKSYVTPEEFADQNLIIHSLPMETVTIHQFFLAPAGVSPKKVTVLPLTEAAIAMVKAEMGIMVMARWALKPYLQHDSLKTIKIGRRGLKRKNFVATLKSQAKPAYFSRFLEFMQREIALP